MNELHQNEQYFYDETTINQLAALLNNWTAPCCLCAPQVGQRLAQLQADVTILDIDQRFAQTPDFRSYDLTQPQWLDREFGIILCDPPFFNVSLTQLFHAIRLLSHFRFDQPLLISYLRRRADAILNTFAPFGLRLTDYRPGYQTVQPCDKNDIVFFSNLGEDVIFLR
jgi:hypothetical protein